MIGAVLGGDHKWGRRKLLHQQPVSKLLYQVLGLNFSISIGNNMWRHLVKILSFSLPYPLQSQQPSVVISGFFSKSAVARVAKCSLVPLALLLLFRDTALGYGVPPASFCLLTSLTSCMFVHVQGCSQIR